MKKLREFLSNFKGVKNSKKKGFTLIELIAVIAILAILAAVLVPNIIGYINRAKQSKVISDAGNIVAAIDAYEADNSENTSALVYADPNATSNNEDSATLQSVYAADTATGTGKNEIFGGTTSPIKQLPASMVKDATIAQIPISELRAIAKKQVTVVFDGSGQIKSLTGSYTSAAGTPTAGTTSVSYQ